MDLRPYIRACIAGSIGYAFPRALKGAGVPLDQLAASFGRWLRLAITSDQALYWISFAVGGVCFMVGFYWPAILRVAKTLVGNAAYAEPEVKAEPGGRKSSRPKNAFSIEGNSNKITGNVHVGDN